MRWRATISLIVMLVVAMGGVVSAEVATRGGLEAALAAAGVRVLRKE